MAKAKPAKPAAKAKKPAPTKASASKPAAKLKAKPGAKPTKPVAKPTKPTAKAKPAKTASKAALKSARKPAPAETEKSLKPAKPTQPAKSTPAKPASAKSAKPSSVKPSTAKTPPAAPEETAPEIRPSKPKNAAPVVLTPFLKKQQERLLQLRDSLLDAMAGVAKDNLRTRAEGSEASAFGMHQADAGSDAYDRDFALSLLSQEQDALYEIEEALKRVELGTYGICEMSGKPISHPRLEALPFARCTVECQSQIEKQSKVSRARVPVTSLFGLTDEEPGDKEDEEEPVTNNDKE